MAEITLSSSNLGGVRAMSQTTSGKVTLGTNDADGRQYLDLGFLPSFVIYYHENGASPILGFAGGPFGDNNNLEVVSGSGISLLNVGSLVFPAEAGVDADGNPHGAGLRFGGFSEGDEVYFVAYR